jgi:uncharacterized membrane-anchored protein YhcB (DUF1043 family)
VSIKTRIIIICIVVCVWVGIFAIAMYNAEARTSQELTQRITELHRENRDRQQRIAILTRESINTVDRARSATERITSSAGAARKNIRDSIVLIEQAIKDYEKLQADLDSLRANIIDIGRVNNEDSMEVASHEND